MPIEIKREGQDMYFENEKELLVFIAETMAHKDDVVEIKNDVDEIKKDISSLKTDVTVLKTDVAILKNDVTILKNDVVDLKLGNGKLNNGLRSYIDKKTEEVKHNTATLLRDKEIINKEESLEYFRSTV